MVFDAFFVEWDITIERRYILLICQNNFVKLVLQDQTDPQIVLCPIAISQQRE